VRFATSIFVVVAACAPAEQHDDPAIVPPVFGEPVLEPWLDAGFYLKWACDPGPRPSSPPAPAGLVRKCTNPIAVAATGAPSWPVDSAFVFELDDGSGGVRGHFVMRRSLPDAGSASWYWYGSEAGAVEADGWGFEGPALTACSACHALAPHDFVY
jgi:hypothetical protein